MDDIVKQALAKWPHVPDCWGWLGLDMRGNWWMRDDAAQAAGDFVHSKGSRLQHSKLIDFIARNYEVDAQGCWFFQNGPQRVFVELEATPMVWRVEPNGSITSHIGSKVADFSQWLTDEQGRLYGVSEGVLGIVHTQDVLHAASLIEALQVPVHEVPFAQLPVQFGFVRSPQHRHIRQ